MNPPRLLLPALLLTFSPAVRAAAAQLSSAQATTLTLPQAVKLALGQGSTVSDAQAGVASAASTLRAVEADPATLAAALLSARQASALAQANLSQARLTAAQNAVTAYTTLYQNQVQLEQQGLQVQVDAKLLQVAQVQLSTRNGTALNVQNAQNTLSSSREALAAGQANLVVNSQKLANVLGKPGSYAASVPPRPPAVRRMTLSTLPALLKDGQAVDAAALSVKLAANEFTARVNLQQAQTALASAQSTLASDQKTYRTALSSAQSAAESAQAAYQNAVQAEANALASYNQDTVRLQSGTISSVALLQSQLNLKKAQYARVGALAAVWQALAALGSASGQDASGLVTP